ncbi:Glucocerebrosidase 1b [Carabus blaptoides fortunei]
MFKLFFLALTLISCVAKECSQRDYGHGSFVCVCNATYCDTVEPFQPLAPGNFIIYSSNRERLRFNKSQGVFVKDIATGSNIIQIDPDTQYQEINGWGGAFTDTSGYNLNTLNKDARENVMKAYFSKDGIEYSLCRVPIGGSDHSLRYYSYNEVPGDVTLSKFNLTEEDYLYKIPFIKDALSLSNNSLKLMASSWNAPLWMKTNNASAGLGFLKKEYYQTWANYHGTWIADNFGPTLRKSNYSSIKIIAFDDCRLLLPFWLLLEFANNKAMNYVDGLGIHWYTDSMFPPTLLDWTRFFFPEPFLLGTEATAGDLRFKNKVVLGNWRRGEMYVDNIIENLEHWYTGWMNWNLAVNLKGGPSYIGNYVDSSIIVNSTAQEFYKNPTYYTMGHFSKFIPPKSVRIDANIKKKTVRVVAFLRPDNGTALVICNMHNRDVEVTVQDPRRGQIRLPDKNGTLAIEKMIKSLL